MLGFFKRKSAKSYAGSVAAFMFLPQFRMMTPFYKELRATFIQILAIAFVEAGILRKNHPATQMHSQNAKTTHILGEAWNYLRSDNQHVGAYQWGVFISVIMMIVLTIATVVMAACRVTYLFTSVASAQLFNHPSGVDTTLDTVPTAIPAGASFDKGAPVQGGGDFAIDILNKVVRQSASGLSGIGGPLQNAFGELMFVYNTGLLVIASFIVFWMLLTFVFGTITTGIVGGGRQSSIWVPIRFIMAMGLLVPLSTGYNSGQYIVMKLAEMGSNLGSQGWYAYVSSAANETLISPYELGDPTDLAVTQGRIFTCMAAVNTYISTFPGNMPTYTDMLTSKEFVGARIKANVNETHGFSGTYAPSPPGIFVTGDIPNVTDDTPLTKVEYLFGNRISDTYCGGITMPNSEDPYINDLANGDPLADMKKVMRQAYIDAFATHASDAHNLACGIVYHTFPDEYLHIMGDSSLGLGYGHHCTDTQLIACGFSPFADPTTAAPTACLETMITNYSNDIFNEYRTVALPILRTYITDTGAGGFVDEARAMGWAGMGVWYHHITRMNQSVQDVSDGGINFISPDFGGWYRFNSLKTKAKETIEFYDQWWENKPTPQGGASLQRMVRFDGTVIGAGAKGTADLTSAESKESLQSLRDEGASSEKKMNTLVNVFYPADGWFLFNLGHYSDVYPMAALQKLGSDLLEYAVYSFAASFLLSFMAGGEFEGSLLPSKKKGNKTAGVIDVGDIILGILSGPIGKLIDLLTGIFVISGLFLTYFLPIIPWMRVSFAVLGWIIAVFEALVMVPILAMSHLKSGGSGVVPPAIQRSYYLLLGILFRPILIVFGYVGGILIFNAMVLYVNLTIVEAVMSVSGEEGLSWIMRGIYTGMYVVVVYVMANSCFKLVDIVPNGVMKWIGAAQDASHDDSSLIQGIIMKGSDNIYSLSNMSGKAQGQRVNSRRNAAREADAPKEPGDGMTKGS